MIQPCGGVATVARGYRASLLGQDARGDWEALWRRSPGHLGLNWAWADCAARDVGRPVRVGVRGENGDLLAGLAFVERRHRLELRWMNTAPAPFAGLLAERNPSESFLRDVLKAAALAVPDAVSRAEVILPAETPDARGLVWQGWRATPHYNYVSEIGAPEALEQSAESAARRQIRKAREAGLAVEWGRGQLPAIIALWEKTRERQGLPHFVAPACYEALLDLDEPGLSAEAALVRAPSGEPVAGGVFAGDAGRVYYLLGASAPDSDEGSGGPSLLHAAVTEHFFRQRGAPFLYDWVGANTETVAQFKKKFRPRLETCIKVVRLKGFARLRG